MGLNFADIFETVVATVPDKHGAGGAGHRRRRACASPSPSSTPAPTSWPTSWPRLGVGVGDHVGCHLYDGNQYVETTLAAFKLRAVPVNVNFRYVDEELTYLFDNADLKVVVTEPDLEDRAVARRRRPRPGRARCWWPTSATRQALRRAARHRPRTSAPAPPTTATGCGPAGRRGCPRASCGATRTSTCRPSAGGGNPALGIDPVRRPRRRRRPGRRRAHPSRGRSRCARSCTAAAGGWPSRHPVGRRTGVVIRDVGFDPAFALRVIADERVSLVMTIGDAYARPIVDPSKRPSPAPTTSSSCSIYGSGGAILSPAVKEALARVLPTTFVHDGFGASETGGQGRLTGHRRRRRPPLRDGRHQRGDRRRRHPVPARRRPDRACWPPAATSRSATTRTRPRRRPRSR